MRFRGLIRCKKLFRYHFYHRVIYDNIISMVEIQNIYYLYFSWCYEWRTKFPIELNIVDISKSIEMSQENVIVRFWNLKMTQHVFFIEENSREMIRKGKLIIRKNISTLFFLRTKIFVVETCRFHIVGIFSFRYLPRNLIRPLMSYILSSLDWHIYHSKIFFFDLFCQPALT